MPEEWMFANGFTVFVFTILSGKQGCGTESPKAGRLYLAPVVVSAFYVCQTKRPTQPLASSSGWTPCQECNLAFLPFSMLVFPAFWKAEGAFLPATISSCCEPALSCMSQSSLAHSSACVCCMGLFVGGSCFPPTS